MTWHLRLVAVSACLLIFGGCGEKEEEVPVSEVAEPFPETTPPPPTATPEPEVVAEATPPPEPRFLPEGEFVIVKRVSVVTDAGIVGAAPGTRVRLVNTSDSAMIVSTGHAEFEVTQEHITNDLDVIDALDAQITAGRPATQSDGGQTVSFQQPRPDMPPPPPIASSQPASDLAERRQKMNQQIQQMDGSIRAMRDKLRELNDQQFRGLKSIHGSYKASQLARDRNTPEESRINGLLQKAEAQRSALEQQRRNLQ